MWRVVILMAIFMIRTEIDLESSEATKRSTGNKRIWEYTKEHLNAEYHADCTEIWSIPCDIALPCATQNEIDEIAALYADRKWLSKLLVKARICLVQLKRL